MIHAANTHQEQPTFTGRELDRAKLVQAHVAVLNGEITAANYPAVHSAEQGGMTAISGRRPGACVSLKNHSLPRRLHSLSSRLRGDVDVSAPNLKWAS